MSLSKKYNIPQETIKNMVNDGVISCSWPRYEEIYAMYQRSLSIGGKTKSQIILDICEKTGYKERMIGYILNKF